MTRLPAKGLFLMAIFFCLIPPQNSFAFPLDPRQLMENRLLRTIDEEFFAMSDDPENLEWTEDDGVQPTDGYELDYAEKCAFIARTRNKKALAACAIILATE